MDVAFAAFSPLAEDKFLAFVREVGDLLEIGNRRTETGEIISRFFAFRCPVSAFRHPVNDRSHRHLHHFRSCTAAMFFLPLPVRSALRLDDRLIEQSGKIIGMDIGPENHVAAAAAVATIRSALRDKFLPPETYRPAPPIPGLGKNFYSIDKHGGTLMLLSVKATAACTVQLFIPPTLRRALPSAAGYCTL